MDEHLEWKQRAEQLQHDFASPTAVTKDMIKYTHDRLFFAFLGCAILCALAPVQLGFRVLVMSGMVFPTKKKPCVLQRIRNVEKNTMNGYESWERFRADCRGL